MRGQALDDERVVLELREAGDDDDPDRPGPQIGPYPDYQTAVQTSLDQLVFGGASVDEVIAQAQAEIQAALETYNEDNAGG